MAREACYSEEGSEAKHATGQSHATPIKVYRLMPKKAAAEALRKKAYKPVTRPPITVYIAPGVVEPARDAVDFLSGPPERLTFTLLLERSLEREVARLVKKYHDGKPFPKRTAPLRRGSRTA